MAILASHDPADAYQNDYHGHPNYVMILIVLIVALTISVLPTIFGMPNVGWVVMLAFGVAVLKAVIVIGNFMHLKYEPHLLWGLLGFALFVFAAFFWGVMPDVNKNFDNDNPNSLIRGEYNTYSNKHILTRGKENIDDATLWEHYHPGHHKH